MSATEAAHKESLSGEENLYGSIGILVAHAGLSPSMFLKRLRSDVRMTPHHRRALTNFHRFLLTGFASTWIRDFGEHRLLQQILLELFSQSQFLADILVRNPELFRWLTSSNVLRLTKTDMRYREEASAATELFQRSEKKLDSLKRFQRRELLRIGARQILKEADVATTSSELSALADSIIEAVLDLAYHHVLESTQISAERELVVIGLGKLGGTELNFSSDIDLMFVYEKDGSLDGSNGRLSTLHEFYVRVAEFVVRRLSEHTGEGHLYRVDMRLRPDGSSGPLTMSRSAYMAYYEARGESWERQMLIKARVIAGSKNVGERWLSDLQPFIFPKTSLASPLKEIARIKTRIESRIGEETNVKLGRGGIRDIEFSIQALQLLNGGMNKEIRKPGSAAAIRSLVDSGYLKSREGHALESAYFFLRTIEDRLQLLHGLQKHSLPESAEERTILARQLGFKSANSFSIELAKHQARIRSAYLSVFGGAGKGKGGSALSAHKDLLGSRELRRHGFVEPSASGTRMTEILALVPELQDPQQLRSLLATIRRHGAADWCVENFQRIASSIPIRRSLQQLLSNEKAIELLTLLCSRTSRFTALLSREPLLFESMVGRPEDLLSLNRGWDFLRHSDSVRYSAYNEFKAVVRFVVGETGIRDFTAELSQLAEEIVKDSFQTVIEEIPSAAEVPIALLALGKLGGREISIGSDIDIVLLYREQERQDHRKLAVSVGRRLREKLTGVYDIDFRLRPEGKSSPLATEYEYYKRYLVDRASLWERQSLIKGRIIAGDEALTNDVRDYLADFVYRTPLPRHWQKDIVAMRQKMVHEHSNKQNINLKFGEGGLADLEYLVQALQLQFGCEYPQIRCTNTFEAAAEIGRSNLLAKNRLLPLDVNLEFFRKLEAYIRMNSETTEFRIPSEPVRLRAVASAMQLTPSATLGRAVDRKRRDNRALFSTQLKKSLRT